jgi:hypothetical protein
MFTRLGLPALACAAVLFSLPGHGVEKVDRRPAAARAAKAEPADPAEAAVALRLNGLELALLYRRYDSTLFREMDLKEQVRSGEKDGNNPRALAEAKRLLERTQDHLAATKKRLVELEKEKRKLSRAAGSAGEAADPADRTARALEKILEKLDSIDKRLEKAERRK